ncbi:MAG: phenylalanine--tRNA ligase subunit alpha [archaeon]
MLREYEKKALEKLLSGKKNIKELGPNCEKAVEELKAKGFVKVDEKIEYEVEILEEGKKYLKDSFPERKILERLKKGVCDFSELNEFEKRIGLGWLKKLELVKIEGSKIVPLDACQKYFEEKLPHEIILERVSRNEKVDLEKLKELQSRKLIQIHEIKIREVGITEMGKEALKEEVEEGIKKITPEIIRNWKGEKFAKYDVTAKSQELFVGKKHPLQKYIDKVKEIFLAMGFEELEGPILLNSFWDFDVLFVSQDNPTREMQDTYYVDYVPDLELENLERVKEVHEKYFNFWNTEISKKGLLRTHTTPITFRALTKLKHKPAKLFYVGRIFRNETLDPTHLDEFHQIEGVILAEDVNLAELIGFLKEFYSRLGFEKIRIRPSYFAYTEPSGEVDVFYGGSWIELGGWGIFRPEILEPFGIKEPVLAWGLGLERLVMVVEKLDDIRKIYENDMKWIRYGKD